MFGSSGECTAGCVGFDGLSGRYAVTLPRGADGGATSLASAADGVTTAVRVAAAAAAGIVAGKSLLVGAEVRDSESEALVGR